MMKLTGAFHNYANMPENAYIHPWPEKNLNP
jgi:hypothetical protein